MTTVSSTKAPPAPDLSRIDPALANGAAWINGRIVPVGEASIPILDWGFTRSDVTYDVVHVWDGSFFRLDDHLDRFAGLEQKGQGPFGQGLGRGPGNGQDDRKGRSHRRRLRIRPGPIGPARGLPG